MKKKCFPDDRAQTRRRVHPLLWDVGLTSVTEVMVLASGLLIVSLFGRLVGAVALGEYLLLRRVASWMQSGAQLGLGVALPRYVAQAIDRRQSDQLAYFLSATACLGAVAVGLSALLMLERGVFARLLFGDLQMANLILPLSLLLLGMAAHTSVYGYYRGHLYMGRANCLQMINLALLPICSVVMLFRARSVSLIVSVIGASMLIAAVLFALPLVKTLLQLDLPRLRPFLSDLLRYGLARVPGEFAGGALVALGPVIASHYLPISEVSRLLLGLSMLMAISVSVTPLGLVLLSKISMMTAQNRLDEVRARLEQLLAAVIELSVFVCLQVIVFADVLVRAWVGSDYLPGITIIQITLLSLPFYLYFVAIRSAIDAATVVAHNAHSGYIALAVFVGLTGLAVANAPRTILLESIAAALLIAYAVLAWRTARIARSLFTLRVPWRESVPSLLLALVLGAAVFLLRRASTLQVGLGHCVLVEAVTTPVFLAVSMKLGSTWLSYFWNLLIGGSFKVGQNRTLGV